MIVCKHCSAKNELDSKFCKSCGLGLSDEDRDRARAEVEKLVADGYSLLGQGRTEEAAMIAEKVLEDAPDFAEALSLLGMCHERNHEPLAALTCYERVVELRPDSALDKVKVQQLRKAISREALEVKQPNRSLALVGALAAIVLVGSIGGIVATLVARPASAAMNADPAPEPAAGAPFSNKELNVPTKPNAAAPEAQPDANPGADVAAGAGDRVRNDQPRVVIPSGRGPAVLPDPSGRGGGSEAVGSEDPGTQPVRPPINDIVVVPSGGGGRPNPEDPQPETTRPGGGGAETEPEDPMKGIEIKVHKGTPVGNGGSEQVGNSEGGLTTLLKAAREQFMLGKWASAASMYERALRAGGDPGSVNQRLGQCYQRLGRNGDAIAAYSRAEAALQAQVNAGRSSAKPALDAVRQALQNLRG